MLTLSASWEEESMKMELEDKLEMGTPVFSQCGARAALLSANFKFSMQRVLRITEEMIRATRLWLFQDQL